MKPAISLVVLTGILCNTGCQSLLNQSVMEKRVVEQFADAVREENEPALRRITSSEFEKKALRSDDVLRDLRVLRLPTGELSVVEVKDLAENRREVIVKEDSGGKYQFLLVHDREKKYWVVDDVIVRQRSKGTQVTKSTTEVMDLLMTLREFLDVWETGSRDEIIKLTTTDLAESLSPLPDEWLQALTKRIASTYEEGMARKPEANLSENSAVVKLPAKNGHLMISIVKHSGRWLVDDVESHNHRETNHPGSIRRQADAMNIVHDFLTAYASEDENVLSTLTTKKFFSTSLEMADLSLVDLPNAAEVPAEFDIRAYENLLTFMLPAGREIVRMDLEEQTSEIPRVVQQELGTTEDLGRRFLVRGVTLYEKGTERQRSLSAVFTAPTRAALFFKALADRDHLTLSQVSTTEFARGTWQRATPDILTQLPIPRFYDDGLKLTNSHSIGARTELEFRNSTGMLLSCRMLNQNGLLKIDDVQYPNDKGQAVSLKSQLELSIPILEFSTACVTNDFGQLQKACSSDFNRLVWSHLTAFPTRFATVPSRLRAPIVDTRVTQERATVRIGDGTGVPLTANLIMEHGFWVVDEINVDDGDGTLVAVRETLRSQIAAKMLSGSYSTVHNDDGFQVVVPVQSPSTAIDMSPVDEDDLSSPEKFFRWANSGTSNLQNDGSGIQQAAAESADEDENRAVEHAVYRRLKRDTDSASESLRVTPAVMTRDVTETNAFASDNGTRPPASANGGNLMLFDRQEPRKTNPVTPASGVQVFGPRASEIAKTVDGVANPGQPNGDPSPADLASSKSVKDDILYFGPASAAKLRSAGDATEMPRIVRQPADDPISIQ